MKSKLLVKLALCAVAVLPLVACGGGSTGIEPPPPPPTTAPVVTSFAASPASIVSGTSSTLSWTVTGNPAPALSIDNGVGAVTGTSKAVSPTATTTYKLTATNSAGTATATATVTVTPATTAPAITSFTASPTSIVSGSSSTLSWTTTGNPAPALSIDNGVGAVTGTSVQVAPTATTTYTLTATNSAGTKTATATVTVTPPPYTIDSIGPSPVLFCNEYHWCSGKQTIKIIGNGFQQTDILHFSVGFSVLSAAAFVSATEVDFTMAFDQNVPFGSRTFTICRAGGSPCTNPFKFTIIANRDLLAQDRVPASPFIGNLFLLDGVTPDGQLSSVSRYSAAGILVGSFPAPHSGIALDNVTMDIAIGQGYLQGLNLYTEAGVEAGGGNTNGFGIVNVAARNGFACGTQPTANSVLCQDIVNDIFIQTPIVIPITGTPVDVAVVQNGSETDVLVLTSGPTVMLSQYSLPNGTLKNAIAVNGATAGDWSVSGLQLAALSSKFVAVMSPADKFIARFDMTTSQGTELGRDTLPGFPIGMFADANAAAGTFNVFYASTAEALPVSVIRVDPAAGLGNAQPLTSTFSHVPMGRGTFLDDTKLCVGEGTNLECQPNQ